MGHHDLLAEPVVAVGAAALALAAPHADEGQQCEQGIAEADALAQVGGVGGQRQVVEGRDVARRRRLRRVRQPRRRPRRRQLGKAAFGRAVGASRVVGDQPVHAYRANQVMTTTAATSMISKKSTTGRV